MKPTNATKPWTATTAWIAVLDSRKGRLFEISRFANGRMHLDDRGGLQELWDEKLHHRPYMLSAQGRSVAAFKHEDEERIRRFAKQVAGWLDEQLRGRALPRLTVFCGHSLVGPLRKALAPQWLERLDLRTEDLAWFTPGELAEHPSVSVLLA